MSSSSPDPRLPSTMVLSEASHHCAMPKLDEADPDRDGDVEDDREPLRLSEMDADSLSEDDVEDDWLGLSELDVEGVDDGETEDEEERDPVELGDVLALWLRDEVAEALRDPETETERDGERDELSELVSEGDRDGDRLGDADSLSEDSTAAGASSSAQVTSTWSPSAMKL